MPAQAMETLVQIIAALRRHCPWMAELTHSSLVEYLVEESYEFIEAVEAGSSADIQDELGDVLLQVVLHAQLAQEEGRFTLDDVARGLSAKMIRRNPHVFNADGSLRESFPATVPEIVGAWHRVKSQERPSEARPSPFHGIPAALPALARAQKSLDRAAISGHGTQTSAVQTPGDQTPVGQTAGDQTPVGQTPAATGPNNPGAAVHGEAELGDLLFGIVRSARAQGLDAERALRTAVRRFQHDGLPQGGFPQDGFPQDGFPQDGVPQDGTAAGPGET